ncbi:sugar ABC transporter permease [Paenibacillus sp. YN15]|uniref:ABC transporter permease n=1 Tax=Paenibacillus sp. YN15 TaxID=1742774 RepID=UPI000DCE2CFF|nr:ABC transporter permease subunit [Paenibacillus sp. YN15]RAU92599.1 sugar ABC transporter permease [Paenibacillus sp. YN15]
MGLTKGKAWKLAIRLGRNVKRDKALLLLLLPGVLYLILNNYLPMFGVVIAFKSIDYSKGILGSDWVGLKNFEFLFQTRDAWIITRNTVLYNTVFIALNLVVAVAFAIALNELRARLAARFYQSVMFLPHFLSMIVVSYLGYSLLSSEFGFINKSVLEPLGFPPVSWYSEAKYWPFILPLVNLWKHVGYYSIVYLAAIIGVDSEYYEAALIDGASKWQQITRITIPLIRPVLVVMILLQIGKIFNSDFGLFYQVPLDSGALFPTTQVIDTYVYRALLNLGDIGMSSAAGLYQALVGFILVLTTNYIVRKVDRENALF